MFKSLKRITYQALDLDKAREWYSALLHREPVFDTPFAVIFTVGGCSLSVIKGIPPLPEDTRRIITYWEVEDVDSAYQTLLEAGALPVSEVKTVFSIKVAQVADPFGNVIGITGDAVRPEEQTVDRRPSEAARTVAYCRALAALDDREEIRGPDSLASIFLSDDDRRTLKDHASREWVITRLITPRLFGYFMARTAYIDEVFKKALRSNIPQIVMLGAGYDTRPYRFQDMIRDTRIFEMDIRPTQQRKRDKLIQKGIAIPEQLSYVTIDFTTETIEDTLIPAGFESSEKTLFIWEGVMYYLSAEAVNSVLGFVAAHSPEGSTICFDHMSQAVESVHSGEPFRFWVGNDDLEAFLSPRGFKMLEHLTPDRIRKRYLTLCDGSTAFDTLPFFSFALASVKSGDS